MSFAYTVMSSSSFLARAVTAARVAGHLFPEFAACEAALESNWGSSVLARQANNLFGQKQSHPAVGGTLLLPTREFTHGAWLTVQAGWVEFADWQASFRARMQLLQRLEQVYPDYRAALSATTGEQFVRSVSRRWSTDPDRAAKVLCIYGEHLAPKPTQLLSA
jgi:flagellum-specific peptidoglycan hydrolase FlgJ